jgi:hypothetical protein
VSSGKKLAFVILAGAGLLFLIPLVDHFSYIYPTPETESAFMKNYSPKTVIEQFQRKNEGANQTNTVSAGAGREFASHESVFESRFVIKSSDWMPLLLALDDDLSSQLSRQGAEILTHTGEPRDGYNTQYRTDKSLGEVVLEPLRLISVTSLSGPRAILQDDEQAVDLRITIREKWFKTKPGMITVKVSSLPN